VIGIPDETRELAEAVILDHDARPRNFGTVANATHRAEGYSPLCGDRYTVSLCLRGDRIQEVQFHGFGCAMSKSSASIMTEQIVGGTVAAALDRLALLEGALLGRSEGDLGDLVHLLGARDYPTRAKCALLPWRALEAALKGESAVQVV
jgi:nitrogen fixation NifU-like protein